MKKSDWSELPTDILSSISTKFDSGKSFWAFFYVFQSSVLALSCVNPSHPPFETKQENENPISSLNFLGFTKVIKFKETVYKCIGSKENWLIIIDIAGNLQILNPFSEDKFDLPMKQQFFLRKPYCDPSKVILSSTPDDKSTPFVAVAIHGSFKHVSFCKSGNTKWTRLGSCIENVDDILFFKTRFSNGKLFIITGDGELHIYTLHNNSFQWYNEIEEKLCKFVGDFVSLRHYLVEMSGKILVVRRVSRRKLDDHFEVYEFDLYIEKWYRVNELDRSLVLGCHSSIAVHSLFWLGTDSIYFTQTKNGKDKRIGRFDMWTKMVSWLHAEDVVFNSYFRRL